MTAMACPCQIYSESTATEPFATEELEKDFWSKLHLMMPQRDANQERRQQERQRREDRARESAAKKGKGTDEGSAQKTPTHSSDSDDRRERERRRQRAGGGTAVESVAERAESDRKRREEEERIAEHERWNDERIERWIADDER